jgi:hypothetical protein
LHFDKKRTARLTPKACRFLFSYAGRHNDTNIRDDKAKQPAFRCFARSGLWLVEMQLLMENKTGKQKKLERPGIEKKERRA